MPRSLSLDPMPRIDDSAEQELMELLKVSEKTETNEADTRHDKAVVYQDPPDRPKGGIDAPWGESPVPPGTKMPNQIMLGDATKDLAHDTRDGVVGRLLSSAEEAKRNAQQTIAQNLAHGASGEFSTHSLLLRPKSIEKLGHAPAESLSEKVRRATR
jgi:hypothetical protein